MILDAKLKQYKFDLTTFGEIMLRLSPPINERINRGEVFDKTAGGSELNVASGVSLLGLKTAVITKIPNNSLGVYIKNKVRFLGVSDDYFTYDNDKDARLGLYFYENGASPRKPAIIYDRLNTSFSSKISLQDYDTDLFGDAKIFHTSGISLAISEKSREVAIDLIKIYKQKGAVISFDVNYRSNLWSEELASETIEKVLPLVDVLFISEESCRRMFKKEGHIESILKSFSETFNISYVASTRRNVKSPKIHDFDSIIYDKTKKMFIYDEPYLNIEVVDRIGSGDAYVAGVLYGLLKYNEATIAIKYGNATASVKNTIPGDLPSSDLKEVDGIIHEHSHNDRKNEMER